MHIGSRCLAVVIYDFEPRGVQRAQIRLANQFSRLGYQVDALVFRRQGPLQQHLSSEVSIVDLDVKSAKKGGPSLVRYLRRRRPLAVFSAEDHINLLILAAIFLFKTRPMISLSCRVCPSLWAEKPPFASKHWITAKLVSRLYPRATQVVMLSNGMADDYKYLFGLSGNNMKVIGNPIIVDEYEAAGECAHHPWLEQKEVPVVMGVGNLSKIKGFDVLLRAFARVRASRKCRLLLVGEGPEREKLLALANELKVSEDVELTGFHSHPMALMGKANLFVLSSRSEGFGNVLVEAMGSGCPVVSTLCGGGAIEIMEDGRLGPLVDVGDVGGLAAAMLNVLANPPDREMLVKSAQRFNTEVVAKKYLEGLLD